MATLREYFDKDFNTTLSAHTDWKLYPPSGLICPTARVHWDTNANAKFLSYFVPACTGVRAACATLLTKNNEALKILNTLQISSGYLGEMNETSMTAIFTQKVFIYSVSDMSTEEERTLVESCKNQGIEFIFRGPRYLEHKNSLEKPLAFLSHDSIDKDDIARPLAIQLQKFSCPVWFDEFSLKAGDNLRESIEKGIKECRKCILILSKSFISNNGWTKKEFDSIFTRELIEEKKLLLPIWHNVSQKEVYEYSPSLANILAVDSKIGIESMAKKLVRSII